MNSDDVNGAIPAVPLDLLEADRELERFIDQCDSQRAGGVIALLRSKGQREWLAGSLGVSSEAVAPVLIEFLNEEQKSWDDYPELILEILARESIGQSGPLEAAQIVSPQMTQFVAKEVDRRCALRLAKLLGSAEIQRKVAIIKDAVNSFF